MTFWLVTALVLGSGLTAAWLYDRQVRARRGRFGSVADTARSSAAGVSGNTDSARSSMNQGYGMGGGYGGGVG